MIQVVTTLAISDNSGAKKARCIKILKKTKKKNAQIGDLIVVSIKETTPKNKSNGPISNKDLYDSFFSIYFSINLIMQLV